jgi:long-subunit acyl-CoA synthetase (AMP-forming)
LAFTLFVFWLWPLAPLFISEDSDINGENPGWSIDGLLIEDATLVLLDQGGNEVSTGESIFHKVVCKFWLIFFSLVGELSITSRHISHGYLKYDNSAFKILPDGWITFKTGDIYERTTNMRYIWKGRKDDYIQVFCVLF